MTTTIKLFGGDLGDESMLVRCNLSEASAPVQVDYLTGNGWGSTQYQCANCRHRTSGLVTVGKSLAAEAVQIPNDDFDCDFEDVSALSDLAAMLTRHGDRFTGGNADDSAQDWIDNGFRAEDADGWCKIGVWDAATAAEFRDADLSPAEVQAAEESLIEAEEDASEAYTDGSPIYAACNNDIDADVIIEAAKAVA